jgi:predicted esterase
LLLGFHGYMESAEDPMARLQSIPGAGSWRLVAIQGLNRFYRGRRSRDVVASWMTRQDRELAIADNQAYVSGVVAEIERDSGAVPAVVFAGFSQGAAMAFRAACASTLRVPGVVVVGGDVPPELTAVALGRVPAVLLGRGGSDEIYTAEQWDADRVRLRGAGVEEDSIAFEGGHEWNDAFARRAGEFLRRVRG